MKQLLDIFEGFRMPEGPGDQYAALGREKLAEKMAPYIAAKEPVEFVMLGFPMKSPNDRDKVLGKLPDLGEELAFQNFSRFNEEISRVYSPGVKINLVSDGEIFADVLNVPDETVQRYEETAKSMLAGAQVEWYNMHSFYRSGLTTPAMRQKVMDQFGLTPEELERRILFEPDVNTLYKGMIKFLTGDIAIREFTSNSQLHKEAKRLAREMMFRNEAYSRLVQGEFKDAVRLSMHPSINNGTKYSFQLIPSQRAWASPWHAAIVKDELGVATIHKKDALAAGMHIVQKDGRPYYFETN
jgi:pyoverdine/dityrosine biosynthesis protein Dit1